MRKEIPNYLKQYAKQKPIKPHIKVGDIVMLNAWFWGAGPLCGKVVKRDVNILSIDLFDSHKPYKTHIYGGYRHKTKLEFMKKYVVKKLNMTEIDAMRHNLKKLRKYYTG